MIGPSDFQVNGTFENEENFDGCDKSGWTSDMMNKIVLLNENGCSFQRKAINCKSAGKRAHQELFSLE